MIKSAHALHKVDIWDEDIKKIRSENTICDKIMGKSSIK